MRTLDLLKRKGASLLAPTGRPTTPVVGAFVVLLSFVELSGLVLALCGISPAQYLNLSKEGLMSFEFWRLGSFVFSAFSPDVGALNRAPLFASLMLYGLSLVAILSGGVTTEQRLGWSRTLGLIIVIAMMQAAVTIVVLAGGGSTEFDVAFSPIGIALGLLCFGQLVEFERNDPRQEAQLDFRLVVTAFLVLTVAVTAAFHPPFKPMLAGLFVGPLVAIALFAANRKAERYSVDRRGYGEVGALFYADEHELLTVEEIRQRTDDLLTTIADEGMESLSAEEQRFLSQASQRLRAVQPPPSDDREDVSESE